MVTHSSPTLKHTFLQPTVLPSDKEKTHTGRRHGKSNVCGRQCLLDIFLFGFLLSAWTRGTSNLKVAGLQVGLLQSHMVDEKGAALLSASCHRILEEQHSFQKYLNVVCMVSMVGAASGQVVKAFAL